MAVGRLLRTLAWNAVGLVISGAAMWLGIRLGQALCDPYSDLRLRLGELIDRVKEVRK